MTVLLEYITKLGPLEPHLLSHNKFTLLHICSWPGQEPKAVHKPSPQIAKLTGIHFKYTMGTGTCILNITCVLRIYQHTVVFASVGCIRLCSSLHLSTNVFSIFFFLSVPLVVLIFSSSEHKSKKGTCSATSLEELPEAILQPTIDVDV